MKISVVQANLSQDKSKNIAKLVSLIEALVQTESPDLVILPEMSAFIATQPDALRNSAEPADGPFTQAMSSLAKRLGIFLHFGSIIELDGDSRFNTSLLFDRNGVRIASYRKIHRFDMTLPNGVEISESSVINRGDEVVVVDVDGVKVGFAICYDLRFAELFRKLASEGAELIVVPSAFVFQTGADHWEILLRARAIETQCYIAAPGQWGPQEGTPAQTWGHSIIIDPWGLIVAQVSHKDGSASARVDLDYLKSVRSSMPVSRHRVMP